MSSRWRRQREPSGGRIARRRQVELVEFGPCCLEDEIAAGGLEPLHQIAGPGVENALPRRDQIAGPPVVDCRAINCRAMDGAEDVRLGMGLGMGLGWAGIANGDQVATAPNLKTVQPIACGQSPATSASTRARGRDGNALKSKVAQVLPAGSGTSIRWRAASGACRAQPVRILAVRILAVRILAVRNLAIRILAEPQGSGRRASLRYRHVWRSSAKACESWASAAWSTCGAQHAGSNIGQSVDAGLAGGHAFAPKRASKLSSDGWATATSLGSVICRGVSRSIRAAGSGRCPQARSADSRCARSASQA